MNIVRRNIERPTYRANACYHIIEHIFPDARYKTEFDDAVVRLNEGLQISYPIEKLEAYFEHMYNLMPADMFEMQYDNSYVKLYNSRYTGIVGIQSFVNRQDFLYVTVLSDMVNAVKAKIGSKLKLIGYDYSFEMKIDDSENDSTLEWINLYYEKKYNGRYIPDFEKIKYLYHITTEENYNRIQVRGLCSRSESNGIFSPNKERIYFKIYPYTHYDFKEFAKAQFERKLLNKTNNNRLRYVLLQITTERLKNIDFYYDPRMEYAVYTFEDIPPDFIKCIDICTVTYNRQSGQLTAI